MHASSTAGAARAWGAAIVWRVVGSAILLTTPVTRDPQLLGVFRMRVLSHPPHQWPTVSSVSS